MNVSVVIPNVNGQELMKKNLPSLFDAVKYKNNKIIEVIVIDDGSSDNSVVFLQKNYRQIKLIKHTKNRGFSASVNTGVRVAKGDLILLLNTDVIPSKKFLEKVLPLFRKKDVFAVSLHEDGYGPAKGFFEDGYIQLAMGAENDQTQPSFYVSGGSGVFRKSIWRELGGMDDKLFSPFYWEDIDLCYRAAKRGYKNLWCSDGLVVHKHESTISKFPKKYVEKIKERNQLLCLWKNIHSNMLMLKHISGLLNRIAIHPGYVRILLMTIPKLKLLFKSRNREFKESKISDEAIFAQFK
jgi:GT2 family glycosyltransferase